MLLQADYSVEVWFLFLEVDVSKHKSYPTILLPVSCLTVYLIRKIAIVFKST